MFTFKETSLTGYQGYSYTLLKGNQVMTFSEVIENWQTNNDFISFYLNILIACPYPAFYWEVRPISKNLLAEAFEFVLINSSPLANKRADNQAFKDNFRSNQFVAVFPNLGGDAQLIVPCPIAPIEHYTHLASFVRNAPKEQLFAFWQAVAKAYQKELTDKTLWLSTAGLGVSWLHVRVDSRPKYYRYKPYKSVNNGN